MLWPLIPLVIVMRPSQVQSWTESYGVNSEDRGICGSCDEVSSRTQTSLSSSAKDALILNHCCTAEGSQATHSQVSRCSTLTHIKLRMKSLASSEMSSQYGESNSNSPEIENRQIIIFFSSL